MNLSKRICCCSMLFAFLIITQVSCASRQGAKYVMFLNETNRMVRVGGYFDAETISPDSKGLFLIPVEQGISSLFFLAEKGRMNLYMIPSQVLETWSSNKGARLHRIVYVQEKLMIERQGGWEILKPKQIIEVVSSDGTPGYGISDANERQSSPRQAETYESKIP